MNFLFLFFIKILPVSSVPPVLAGGDHDKVALLLVMLVTCRFSGHDGGANDNKNNDNNNTTMIMIITYFEI